MSKSEDEVRQEFADAVNMTPKELEDFLQTDDSKKVGQKKDGSESIGHESGRRIVEILRKKKTDIDEHDVEQMRRVVSYVHRHLEQRPEGDVEDTDWRYSLMNWGHDPTK